MKRIILIALILFPLASFAQQSNYLSPSYDQEVDFGIRLGWGQTTYSNYKGSELEDSYDFSTWGWGAGMFLQLRVNHIYFQPEIFYIKSYIDLSGPDPDDTSVNGDLSLDFTNIQVPLVVGYRFGFGESSLRVGAGLFFNFLVNSKGDITYTPGDSNPISEEALGAFNDLSMGWRFNVGFDVGPILLDAHFQAGFSRGEEFVTYLGADLGNSSNWGFAVGYKLFRNKL